MTIRDLRNRGAEVMRRVERGTALTVTRDGDAVALLSPLPRRSVQVGDLIARRQHLPRIDAAELRDDVDALIDPAL